MFRKRTEKDKKNRKGKKIMLFNGEKGPFLPPFKLEDAGMLEPIPSKDSTADWLSTGFETLDRDLFDPDGLYEIMGKTGVRKARLQSGWARCERAKGVYTFEWLDSVVDNLVKEGITPWMCLSYGNPVYTPSKHPAAVACPPVCFGPEAVEAWKKFVAEVVRRYRNKVCAYEVWNEPDGQSFWGPGRPDLSKYLELVEITAKVVRENDPEAEVIGTFASAKSAAKCIKMGLGKYCDIVSYHSYTMYPEFYSRMFTELVRCAKEKYAPHLKIWHAESGCPSQSKDHYDEWIGLYHCTHELQAKWVARRISTDFRNNVELFSYYHTSDLTKHPYVNGRGIELGFGRMGLIAQPGNQPKLSCRTFANCCRIFDASTKREQLFTWIAYNNVMKPLYEPEKPRDLFTNVICDSYIRKGYPMYLYYYPGDLQRENVINVMEGNTFTNTAENKITEPVLLDLVNGNIYRFKQVAANEEYLEIMYLPLTDYPLVLTDLKAL